MKIIYSISFILLMSFPGLSQTANLDAQVIQLKMKIKNAEGDKQLMLLDSLTQLIEDLVKYDFETITEQTIQQAIQMDSINLAAKHVSSLILFLTNRVERPQEGLILFENFSPKMKRVTDSIILTELLLRGASSYYRTGQGEKSLHLYDKAKETAIANEDSSRYGKAMVYKAFVMSQMGQFANSSQEYQKALAVFDSRKDTTNILNAKIGLSVLYGDNALYKESFEELAYVENVSRQTKNYPMLISSLTIAANFQFESGRYQNAINPLKEAIKLSKKFPKYSTGITNPYSILANSYSKLDSISSAKKTIDKIEAILITSPDKEIEANYLLSKTYIAFAKQDFEEADSLGKKLLKVHGNSDNYKQILTSLEILYNSNKALGNQNLELKYLKAYTRIKDSINTIRKINAFSHYQTLYETEKRDAQIANQTATIDLLAAQKKVQFQWMLLLAVTLLSIGLYFYLISKKRKSKIAWEKNKKALAQQKVKAINLENELLNREIEYKKKDLANFALEISQNYDWAKVLFQKFENIKNAKIYKREIELNKLGNEIKDKLLIDVEFKEFHEQIDKIGSSFHNKLIQKSSNLTKAELKLCTLIRMNINPKQIAALQNITHTSVITGRYRLKKKFNLKPNQGLDTFIHNL